MTDHPDESPEQPLQYADAEAALGTAKRELSEADAALDAFAGDLGARSRLGTERYHEQMHALADKLDTSRTKCIEALWPVYEGTQERLTRLGQNYGERHSDEARDMMMLVSAESVRLERELIELLGTAELRRRRLSATSRPNPDAGLRNPA